MYGERISSSFAASRFVPPASIAMSLWVAPRSAQHLGARWRVDLSRLSLFTPRSGGRELDWHPVALLELPLLGRARAQEAPIGFRDYPTAVAAHLPVHLIDAPPASGDRRLCGQQLPGIGGCAVSHVHLRGHGPGVVAGGSPGHHLVEQRGQDPAVDLVFPANVVLAGTPLRAGRSFAELDLEAHADRVLPAAGEAVVIRECVSASVLALDDPAGLLALRLGRRRAHQGS